MKSRRELKEYLQNSLPPGSESQYLRENEEKLDRLQTELKGLQEQRAQLRRQITIRERKLLDWKSKIPRVGNTLPAICEVADNTESMSDIMCHDVGQLTLSQCFENNRREFILSIRSQFIPGLKRLADFKKIWLVIFSSSQDIPSHCGESFKTCDDQHCVVLSCQGNCFPINSKLSLLLVDLLHCDERTGILRLSPTLSCPHQSSISPALMGNVTVVDIKPYISYCDSVS